MNEQDGRALNRESYDAIASSWDSARAAFNGREREYLDALLDGLPGQSDILDLGCGTGRPMAEYMLARGHHVTGVDQSDGLLELARSRFPQATWITGSIEEFVTGETYHAIVCWDALFHIVRTEHQRLFERFAALLTPGGRLMMTFGGSAHPAFTDTMFGRMFFYDSHPPEEALGMLTALGFVPVVSEFMNLPTPGRDKGRYAVVAERVRPPSGQ